MPGLKQQGALQENPRWKWAESSIYSMFMQSSVPFQMPVGNSFSSLPRLVINV